MARTRSYRPFNKLMVELNKQIKWAGSFVHETENLYFRRMTPSRRGLNVWSRRQQRNAELPFANVYPNLNLKDAHLTVAMKMRFRFMRWINRARTVLRNRVEYAPGGPGAKRAAREFKNLGN